MTYATLNMKGKNFVLVPEAQFKRLLSRRERPVLPPKNQNGTYPAVAAARVNIARTIIQRRRDAGLSQSALANAAGIRVETLNRIERGKVTADTATIAKIDRALANANA